MEEDRLVKIETKLAFQEKVVNDLNDVILEQQKKIEQVAAMCAELAKQCEQLSDLLPGTDAPANEKPPHY